MSDPMDIICGVGALIGAASLFSVCIMTSPNRSIWTTWPFYLRASACLSGAGMLFRSIDFFHMPRIANAHADAFAVTGWIFSTVFLASLTAYIGLQGSHSRFHSWSITGILGAFGLMAWRALSH
jgi:hypothetical protein